MRHITEVLRLNAQGLSYRQIAQSVGISASTVQSYLERAQRAGLSWPLPVDLDDAAIEAQLFTRTEEELRPGRPEPDWLEVHRQRKRGKHVTLQLLHLEYKAVHPQGLSYTQFCVHYRRWRAPGRGHAPGVRRWRAHVCRLCWRHGASDGPRDG